jgi:hypothetical protein
MATQRRAETVSPTAIRLRNSVPPEAGRAEAGSLKIAFILTMIRGQRPQLQAGRS